MYVFQALLASRCIYIKIIPEYLLICITIGSAFSGVLASKPNMGCLFERVPSSSNKLTRLYNLTQIIKTNLILLNVHT